MTRLNLVTGNQGKLAEWRRLVTTNIELDAVTMELDEIQTLDLEKLVTDKAHRAYEVVGKPVVVEDIAAGLDRLNGMPGPFIKFFEQEVGENALFQLAKESGEAVTVTCAVAYFDGQDMVTVLAEVHGKVVSPRGDNGFGFDKVFLLDGQTKTYGEMTTTEKDAISHRGLAVRQLLEKIRDKLE